MSQRSERHARIIEIINSKDVETQDELCIHLKNLGYDVTQATICRDVKELGLVKISSDDKHYKYAYMDEPRGGSKPKLSILFKEIVLKIRIAGNLLVVKTMAGSANTAAAFIDALALDNVVGCIAGDDTIFVAVDNAENTRTVLEKLNESLR